MSKRKDYYGLLGLSKSASEAEMKSAYRKMAKKFHPDLHPNDKVAEAKFKEVSEAYAVLSDPEKKRQFDLGGDVNFEGSGFGGQGGAGGGFNSRDFGFGSGGMEDIFADIFGSQRGQGRSSRSNWGAKQAPVKGKDIESRVQIDFFKAIKGTEVVLTVKRNGDSEKITVRVPSGIKDGSKIKVTSKGDNGINDGPRGDLFLNVNVVPHKYFKRVGNDIYIDVPVTINEAIIGEKIEIPTIHGNTTIKIPAGAQGGLKLRIKGKGIDKGDQYVVLTVALPKVLNKQGRKLLKDFEETNPYTPRRGLW